MGVCQGPGVLNGIANAFPTDPRANPAHDLIHGSTHAPAVPLVMTLPQWRGVWPPHGVQGGNAMVVLPMALPMLAPITLHLALAAFFVL